MATFLRLPHILSASPILLNPSKPSTQSLQPRKHLFLGKILKPPHPLSSPKVSINGDANNGAVESSKPSRRGGKKKPTSPSFPSRAKRTKRSMKTETENGSANAIPQTAVTESDEELGDYDDGIEFPYANPPLICCFGAAQKEFVPMVLVNDQPMHPDIYSSWKWLQWTPPDFSRAPGGPPCNVAISHVRLGGRAAFMGKVGFDKFGKELVSTMNTEKVQTRAVRLDKNGKTARSYMKIKFEDDKMKMEMVKEPAEDSLLISELNIAVLKEARIFHFNAEVLTSPSMQSTLYRAIRWSKKFGGLIFFDLNLPLMLFRSSKYTKELVKKAWNAADIIEVSPFELEFLLDDVYYGWKRKHEPQYHVDYPEITRRWHFSYHFTPEEISPLWHDKLKILFVTDGTHHIHYYTPSFDGVVKGIDETIIAYTTCDRSGSGDVIVAALLRKLATCPEMFEDQESLEKQIRFAISAGVLSQWTTGAIRSFPTENAAENFKKMFYLASKC